MRRLVEAEAQAVAPRLLTRLTYAELLRLLGAEGEHRLAELMATGLREAGLVDPGPAP